MDRILAHLAQFFISLGGPGLLLLSALDSSFLFFPLGNDLLMVLMTVHQPQRMLYYALMSSAGSALGCFITDALSRKGGQAGLEGRVSQRRLKYVQTRVEKNGSLFLILAALMPPPFPFTLFVIVAAALQFPRFKLLGIVAATRVVRFLLEGWLAIHFGSGMLRVAKEPLVQGIILSIVVKIGRAHV